MADLVALAGRHEILGQVSAKQVDDTRERAGAGTMRSENDDCGSSDRIWPAFLRRAVRVFSGQLTCSQIAPSKKWRTGDTRRGRLGAWPLRHDANPLFCVSGLTKGMSVALIYRRPSLRTVIASYRNGPMVCWPSRQDTFGVVRRKV